MNVSLYRVVLLTACAAILNACDGVALRSFNQMAPASGGPDFLEPGTHRVFLTSQRHYPDFGGVTGADQICQSAADTAGLAENYMAILSDNSSDVIERMASRGITGPVYKYFSNSNPEDRVLIVSAAHGLFDSSSDRAGAIDVTENLEHHFQLMGSGTVSRRVWSGTKWNGTAASRNCLNWTSRNVLDRGYMGAPLTSNSALVTMLPSWITLMSMPCGQEAHLYCISY